MIARPGVTVIGGFHAHRGPVNMCGSDVGAAMGKSVHQEQTQDQPDHRQPTYEHQRWASRRGSRRRGCSALSDTARDYRLLGPPKAS